MTLVFYDANTVNIFNWVLNQEIATKHLPGQLKPHKICEHRSITLHVRTFVCCMVGIWTKSSAIVREMSSQTEY